MTIDDLLAVLPVPAHPIECGSDAAWLEAFGAIGIRLPEDYVQFINRYGSGAINDDVVVLNPFSVNPSINLIKLVPRILSGFRNLRQEFPDRYPDPLYFEPGGILPWGVSSDGSYFLWRTTGLQGTWPIVVYPRHADHEIFEMRMTQFLARLLRGEIRSQSTVCEFGDLPPAFEPLPHPTA